MAVKINELATSAISLSDFLAKADASGIATKTTIQSLASFLETTGDISFKGGLAIADTPVVGWYFAEETGTYTNVNNIAVDVSDTLTILIVNDPITNSQKVEIPVTLTIDAVPTSGSTNVPQSGGTFDSLALKLDKSENYNVNSYRINESASSATLTSLNLLSTELLPKGIIKTIKINIDTIGNLKFACFRKLDTLKYQLIKQFDYNITSTGVQTLTINKSVDEDFYFGVVNGSVAKFLTESTGVGDPFNLNFFSGTFNDASVWTESVGRTTNIEINVLKSEFIDYVNSLNKTIFDDENDLETATMKATAEYVASQLGDSTFSSFPYNNSYSSASVTSLNLTTSELLPKGIIKTITLKVVSNGICRFAFLRPLATSFTYKPIKYFECAVVTGENIINVNEFIDEDFHFCLLSGSVSIYTASTSVGDAVNLHFTASPFTDSTVWSVSSGRGNNIQVDIDTNELNFPTKKTGKSITYCGDSITDFCDSPSSNGVQYIGFDAHIQRYIKFNIKNIYGFSGIKLAQIGGFADARISAMPTSDYYVVYLGTNDFALATQSTLGTITDYNNSTGVGTFYGAMRTLINGIYTKNAYAKIIFFTPNHRDYSGLDSWVDTNSNGNTLNDFAEAIRNVCAFNGFYLIDLMKDAQINRNNFSLTTYDNLHPNTRGYQEIAEAFITKLYNKF